MRINIVIDDTLIHDAILATGLCTKREVVELGLQALLLARQRKQASIKRFRGKLHWQGALEAMRLDRQSCSG